MNAHENGPELESEFGYKQELPRVLRFWTNWAIAFAFISPIVGLYTVVALGMQTAGAAWVWTVAVVIVGQMLVAFVLAELSARWPIAGGIYQWSGRLLGAKAGWWAGWVYGWAIIVTLALVAYGGGTFLGELLGIDNPSHTTLVLLAVLVLVVITAVNLVGLHLLRYIVNIGIACEATATLGIGIVLWVFSRHQSPSVLFHASGLEHHGLYVTAFVAALAPAGWVFLGFDTCGAIAEETHDPRRAVPRATWLSMLSVGIVDMIAATGIIVGQPNLEAAVSGKVADPISYAVTDALGSGVDKAFLAVLVAAFVSCGIAVEAGGVRLIYAYARDDMLPFARVWRLVPERYPSPVFAVLLTGVLAGIVFLYANVLNVLVGFATGGYYLAFLLPVGAALYLRVKRRWRSDRRYFNLGRIGLGLTAAASIWLVVEFVNIAWPRSPELPWYQNWAVIVASALLGIVGLGYFLVTRPDQKPGAAAAFGSAGSTFDLQDAAAPTGGD